MRVEVEVEVEGEKWRNLNAVKVEFLCFHLL